MPADPKKIQALRASGTLNPHPEKVRAPRFAEREFFDPNDLVQLKYETLRALEVDGQSLSAAAVDSGLSRPTVYEAQSNFLARGMEGLLPKKRGPKNPRKLKPEVREFLEQSLGSDPGAQIDRTGTESSATVRDECPSQDRGESLEEGKKGASVPTTPQAVIIVEKEVWKSRYEKLRQQSLESSDTDAQDRWGLGLLLRKGVAGWMRAWRDPSLCFDVATADQVTSIGVPRCSWQQEATLLLANMALSHCDVERLNPSI